MLMPLRAGRVKRASLVNSTEGVAGLILAGGRSSRMNAGRMNAGRAESISKARLELAGEPLLAHVVRRLKPQVTTLMINTNDNPDWYRQFGAPVVADCLPDYPGPLTGLVSGMLYAAENLPQYELVVLVPCDGPFLPADLVSRLRTALEAQDGDVACVGFRGHLQPTFSLWRRRVFDAMKNELMTLGYGGFKDLMTRLHTVVVDWPEGDNDPFFNINTPADLARAEELIARGELA